MARGAVKPSRAACIPAAVAAALYLSIPAARYNFDGVACATAVDLGDFRHLVHGNHLAYAVFGYLWHSMLGVLGYHGPSLYSLQAFSSLLSAAGIGFFTLLLTRCGVRAALAVCGAAGLMFSKLYWEWALEAQVYPLGAFFLLLAAAELAGKGPRPARIGLWHAGAILGHVGNVMFAPVVWYWLPRPQSERIAPPTLAGEGIEPEISARRKPRGAGASAGGRMPWNDFGEYLIAVVFVVVAAYAAAAVFCVRPRSWEEIRAWLLGSAALNAEKSFSWHGGYSFSGIKQWLRLSLNLWGGGAVAGPLALAAAVYGAFESEKRKIARGAVLWLASYAVLYLAWEPYTPVYRITDLAPLWLLAALGAERLSKKIGETRVSVGLACAVAGLAGWNLSRTILPGADPAGNVPLQRALWIKRQTPENAWIAAAGIDEVYIPYFGGRKPINLQYFQGREAQLKDRLNEAARRGEPVFVVPRQLDGPWRRWFLGQKLSESSRRGGDVLYQLGL